jgi:glycerophosphoryl diester phosphodiesterase
MHTVYAHRGSSLAFAENTRAAFLQAVAEGADGIECDVHLTRDLEVVCLHDDTVDRTSTGTGDVAELTLRELRALDVSSWKGARIPERFGAPSQQLVTLAELVGLMLESGRDLGLAIELKHPSPFGRDLERRVLEELRGLGWDPATSRLGTLTVSLMSFDPGSIDHLSREVPVHALCQLVTGVDEDLLDEFGPVGGALATYIVRRALEGGVGQLEAGRAGLAGPGLAWVRQNTETARRWLAEGIRLRVWTVDEDEDIDFLADLGVSEFTSNRPAHVKERLARR